MITKQGLRVSLDAALEYGFKASERGQNLEEARFHAADMFDALVVAADNCPDEVLRIMPDRRKHSGTVKEG